LTTNAVTNDCFKAVIAGNAEASNGKETEKSISLWKRGTRTDLYWTDIIKAYLHVSPISHCPLV